MLMPSLRACSIYYILRLNMLTRRAVKALSNKVLGLKWARDVPVGYLSVRAWFAPMARFLLITEYLVQNPLLFLQSK